MHMSNKKLPTTVQFTSQEKQIFYFGKKFFGKKLDNLINKKEIVQILKQYGHQNYLSSDIIKSDLNGNKTKIRSLSKDNVSSFLAKNNNQTKNNSINSNNNNDMNVMKQFRIKINKSNDYINNVKIKPKYSESNVRRNSGLVRLSKNQIKSMQFLEENEEETQKNVKIMGYLPSEENVGNNEWELRMKMKYISEFMKRKSTD